MELLKLKEVCKLLNGYAFKSPKYVEHGIRIIRIANVQDGFIVDEEPCFYPNDAYEEIEKYILKENDLLISLTGNVGRVGVLRKSLLPAALNQRVGCIRPLEGRLTVKYLYYFLRQRSFMDDCTKSSKGVAQLNLSTKWLENYIIPVPTLDEQKRIVERIEESFSELDKAEETLLKIKSQLEIYKQAVLKEAFLECDNDIKLSCLCECITDGDHMPPPKADNGIPFVMISNIKNNVIQWENTAFVGNDYYNNLDEKRKPRKNDVLYTVTGSFGIPVLVDFEKNFCFQRHIALLRPNEQILPHFLYYSLQHPTVYLQASKRATGTAQKTVGLGVLRNIEIPFVNSLQTQRHIVNKIEAEEYKHNRIKKVIIDTLMKIKALRQSILKEAFEGKLV